VSAQRSENCWVFLWQRYSARRALRNVQDSRRPGSKWKTGGVQSEFRGSGFGCACELCSREPRTPEARFPDIRKEDCRGVLLWVGKLPRGVEEH
jgi:hypothetical protein